MELFCLYGDHQLGTEASVLSLFNDVTLFLFHRFYRYVLEPQLTFNEDGQISDSLSALFLNMPQSALLTLNMDTPQSWMVEAVRSSYDLDNIHLKEVGLDRTVISINDFLEDAANLLCILLLNMIT